MLSSILLFLQNPWHVLLGWGIQQFATVGLWVSGSNNEAMALVADWSNTQQFDCYAICDSKEIGDHEECYLYDHYISK